MNKRNGYKVDDLLNNPYNSTIFDFDPYNKVIAYDRSNTLWLK